MPDSIATTWLQAARWWTAVSDYPAALRALDRGLAAAQTQAERLELAASRVVVLMNRQQVGPATAQAAVLAEQLQADADALPADRLSALLFAAVSVVAYSTEPQRLAALCEGLRARCTAGPPRAQLSFHLAAGTCLNWLGRPLQAGPDLQLARRLADGFGDHGSIVNVTHQQLRNALLTGDTPRAQAAAHDCAQAVQAGGYGSSFRLHAWAAQALVAVAAGQPAAALAALRGLQKEMAGIDPGTEEEVAAAQAMAWHALGQGERVAEVAAQAPRQGEGWLAFVRWRVASTPAARQAALAALARRWPAEDGVMGWRRRVLAAALAPPALPEADALVQALRDRALWPLARRAHVIAAQAAGRAAAADPHAAVHAAAHARHALALAVHVDPWTDDHASVWRDAAMLLRASGQAEEADAALAAGRAWLAQAGNALSDPADRAAWFDGHPLHRALRAGRHVAVPAFAPRMAR
jgi:hypothetical protein